MKYIEKNPERFIILVCAAIFFMHLDVMYVNIMEARNFITAREMVFNHNWLLTTMNDLPRYEKPPLPTWLTGISGMFFVMKSVFALRFPAALAGLFMVIMLYRFSNISFQNKKLSIINSLVLATSFYVIFSGRNGQWDIFTHSFMLAAIYFIFLFFKRKQYVWENGLLAAIFIGFSFLSKGPVSVYALLLPFLLAFGFTYKFRKFKKKVFPLLFFIVVALGISLWWYVYVRVADAESFLAITNLETSRWRNYNVRPFYYYWSFFTQSGIWTIPAFISLLYPYLKNRVSNKRGYLFSFLWTIFSVILLSIIPEKKSRYLLPVLIPLAINIGFYIEYLIRKFSQLKDKKETFPVYFNFGLIALIGISFPIMGYIFFGKNLDGLWLYFILVSIALFNIGIFILLQLKKKNIKNVFLLTIAFIMSIMTFGFPLAKTFNTNTHFRNIDGLQEKVQQKEQTIYVFQGIAPEMIWEYGTSIPLLMKNDNVIFPEENIFNVLVSPNQESEFKRIFEPNFELLLMDTFDINYTKSPDEKGHKKRLISKLYLVKKQ